MKMKQVRKSQQNVAPAVRRAVLTKVASGRRVLPVINALEVEPAPSARIQSVLQCDHVAVSYENVTPAKAAQYLKHNDTNRKIYDSVVLQYMYDLDNGAWTFCTAPLSFYEDGNIADGQHRLTAIKESGKTVKMMVMRGLHRSDGLNIDTGRARNVVDGAKISGADPNLTTNLVSVARSIEEGIAAHTRTSNTNKLQLVHKHREAANFAIKHVYGKKLSNGAVLGAIGRAWYKVDDKDKLIRFCEVLRNGQSQGLQESAAVTLRNYLIQSDANLASSALWHDTFLRVQHSIKCFVAGRQLLHSSPLKHEAYPL